MATISCTSVFLQLSILTLHAALSYAALSCRGEQNEKLDWYVGYKLPKLKQERENPSLQNGTAFAYISSKAEGAWKLAAASVSSPSSILGNTLNEIVYNREKVTYLLYNDDPPREIGKIRGSSGHLKGVLGFDGKTGFWLIHSIPRFGDSEEYYYPDNAVNNGQSVLCITLRTEDLNEICKQLLYADPNIYDDQLTDEIANFLDDDAYSIFTDEPELIREEPFTRQVSFTSVGGQRFVSFAKDNQYEYDLYSKVVAPGMKVSLQVETWRNGAGGRLMSNCRTDFQVTDVQTVNMKLQTTEASFPHAKDHSKWAISDEGHICIADMNRMRSQFKRGGGAVCFLSKPVANAYRSIIDEVKECAV